MSVQKGNNVSFLIGTQDKINTLLQASSGIQAGAFYVTNDTHRMYFGAATDKLVALNQGVKTVASLKELDKEAGQFYYVASENVLCVYNGTQWVQINPDTAATKLETAVSAVTNNTTTVSTTLTDNHGNTFGAGAGESGVATFSVKGENIVISVAGKVMTLKGKAYTLGATANGDIQLKDTSNNNAVVGSVTIAGGNHITVSGSGSTITINGEEGSQVTKVETGVTAGDANDASVGITIQQSGSQGNKTGAFRVVGGEGVAIATDGSNGVKITSESKLNAKAVGTDNKAANVVLSQNGTERPAVQLKAGANVSSIKVTADANDTNPDVIEINVTDSYISQASAVNNASDGFDVTLTNANSAKSPVNFSIKPQIKYGEGGKSTAKFAGGNATLDVYTQAEVDKKLEEIQQQADAMRFMGVASTADELTKAVSDNGGAHVGDTYKATGDFMWNSTQVRSGDLLIVLPGTEVNGVIANPTWSIVPSGNDDYTVETSLTNGIQIRRVFANGHQELGGLAVAIDSDDVALTIDQSVNSSTKVKTLTVGHAVHSTETTIDDTTQKQTAKTPITIPAVTAVTRDKNGHVTGVNVTKYEVIDTHNSLDSVAMSVASITGGTTVSTQVTTADGSKTGTMRIVSSNDSLQVSAASSTQISMNLVWGEF